MPCWNFHAFRTPCFSIPTLFLAFAFLTALSLAQPQNQNTTVESHARAVVAELAGRQFTEVVNQISPQAAASFSADRLAEIWNQFTGMAGAFKSIESVQVTKEASFRVAVVTCAFEKSKWNIVLSFDSADRIAGLHFVPANSSTQADAAPWRAPGYADTAKFHETSVTISDGQWHLPGTLTLPNGKGPFPAVVLVSGSGPNDTDETIGPNKPMKDIAWGLASNGIAVLRYPKRTRQYGAASMADSAHFTVKDEYIDDARAAVALLSSRDDINASRIFLAGHSEGGYLAPRIANGDSQIAGIIILEGNTRPIEQLVVEQLNYLASLSGPNAAKIKRMIPKIEKEAQEMESPDLKPGTTVLFLGASLPSSYFLDLRGYDPSAVAAELKIPILVIQGGRDYQVTKTDFSGWQRALSGHANATFKFYPDLDHLLFAGTGPSSPEEYLKPGQHVSAQVVTELATWIQSHSREP